MRVAVTGGSGFIGSHVVDKLVDAGHDVVVVDTRAPESPDAEHTLVDVGDVDGLAVAFKGCDAVFHLAAMASVNDVFDAPVRSIDLNVLATTAVWEAARRCEVERAVLASTVWVYGAAAGTGPVDETSPFDLARAGHLYTSSKLAAEMVAISYRELYGQHYTILRYGIPYGPRMRSDLVIPRFVSMAMAGDPISVHGDGLQHRNYIYVEDLAAAHVLALATDGEDQVFNLEGPEPVTVRAIVEAVERLLERPLEASYGPSRPGDFEGREISAAKAADVLGWKPHVRFDEGMRRYVEWHLAQRRSAVTPAR